MQLQHRIPRIISCEFFPPADAAAARKLRETRAALLALEPAFFSVTYGAGGSTRNRTFEAVMEIHHEGCTEATPHLTCIASTRASLRAILDYYRRHGIRRLVALRGDLPTGMQSPGELRFANELVELIRAETDDHFHIEVAAYPEFHPQAASFRADLDHFRRKVDAGANSAITQYFFNPDAYWRFMDNCWDMGVTVPVVPGIMPITNYRQIARFSDMCGAELPRWIRARLETLDGDLPAIREFGEDVVSGLCERLLGQGAPGLHFYTMNRAGPTLAIARNVGLVKSGADIGAQTPNRETVPKAATGDASTATAKR